MENSPYMDAMVASRAMLLNEEEALLGQTLISVETTNSEEQDIYTYIQENPADFFRYLRFLSIRDQELLLMYYFLGKTQSQLAAITRSTQTVCSFNIRMATRVMAAIIGFGGQTPTVEQMTAILKRAGFEQILVHNLKGDQIPFSMAALLDDYFRCRSFQEMADRHKLHRPDIRRMMSRVNHQLQKSEDPEEKALGCWMFNLIDKASPSGQGYSARHMKKQGDLVVRIPDTAGRFVNDIQDPNFGALFCSRANL